MLLISLDDFYIFFLQNNFNYARYRVNLQVQTMLALSFHAGRTILVKQAFYIHRKEIFSTNAAITYENGRMRIKHLTESFKSFSALFCVALHLYGNHNTLFPKYKIHLVTFIAPIEYFEAMHESLTNQITANARLIDTSPSFSVYYSLFKDIYIPTSYFSL